MIRLALIGYGAMGRELATLAASHDCTVTATYDVDTPLPDLTTFDWDVAIDFSSADAVLANASVVAGAGKGLVVGTTGWNDQLPQLRAVIQSAGTGCVYGSNFSVGVQTFFRLVRAAGVLINDLAEYDVMVHEWHHQRKKDSPSGTALTLADILLDVVERKGRMKTETQHQRIDPEALHVTSTRGGEIPGRHLVTIDGPHDRIELVHDARSRAGFASGALRAAHWIKGRTGIYEFTDIFTEL
jgi:4-hydroxy-tetrahydrodipicolinate reductase